MTSEIHGELYTVYYETFLNYVNDNTIFNTANNFLAPYKNKDNLPFYYSEIIEYINDHLGLYIPDLLFQGSPLSVDQGIATWNREHAYNANELGETDEPEAYEDLTETYPTETFDAFERDFTAFCLFNRDLFSHPVFVNSGNIIPFGLSSIQYIDNQGDDSGYVSVLLERNDGQELSFLLNKYNLDSIINSFKQIRNKLED